VRNVQILIFSAVMIRKECLKTASASEVPQTHWATTTPKWKFRRRQCYGLPTE